MIQNRLKYCLVCEEWGKREQEWLSLIIDNYQSKDNLELNIYIFPNKGLKKADIEAHISNILANHTDHLVLNLIETDDPRSISCDYMLSNPFFKEHQPLFQDKRFGIIEDIDLKAVETSYSSHFPSKYAYEYDFIVDSYDLQRRGIGFEVTEAGLIPRQFGSSGGKNFEAMLRIINQYCNSGEKMLEIGCGAGAFYETLRRNRKLLFYTGTDISRKQIIRAKGNYPLGDFRVGNVCNLKFQDDYFDLVLENNVIIFVTDPLKAIAEMCRVSRGYVYFNIDVVKANEGLYCYYPFTHALRYDLQTKQGHVSAEQRRFFNRDDITYYKGPDDIAYAMVTKVPTYVPSMDEFSKFMEDLKDQRSVTIVKETASDFTKSVFINPNKKFMEIIDDDCVVTKDDHLIDIDAIHVCYLLKKY